MGLRLHIAAGQMGLPKGAEKLWAKISDAEW
jgi:hypothetical protein